jgi:hypothetical protein
VTIFGWDQSHFDAPSIGDAVGEGITFLTHKAGGDRDDPELGAWWSNVRGLDPDKALLGAYWVLYPGSPASRADAFLARLDFLCPGWRLRPFMLQVDCEKWNGDSSTVPGKADIRAFCDRLVARCPKLRPIVYAPSWVYGDSLTGLGYPLWASRYVTGTGGFRSLYPGDSSSKWAGYSGQTPAILQYTSSATIGGQTTCDANAYRGTLAQLTALVAPGWSEDMALDDTDVAKIITGVRNAREFLSDTEVEIIATQAAAKIAPTLTALGQSIAGLAKTVNSFVTSETTDDAAKSASLQALQDAIASVAPTVTAAVVAALPPGSDPVSQDEVTAAVEAAFRHAFSAS